MKSDTVNSSDDVSSVGGMSSRLAPTNVYTENPKEAIIMPSYGRSNGTMNGATMSKNSRIVAASKNSQLETYTLSSTGMNMKKHTVFSKQNVPQNKQDRLFTKRQSLSRAQTSSMINSKNLLPST